MIHFGRDFKIITVSSQLPRNQTLVILINNSAYLLPLNMKSCFSLNIKYFASQVNGFRDIRH